MGSESHAGAADHGQSTSQLSENLKYMLSRNVQVRKVCTHRSKRRYEWLNCIFRVHLSGLCLALWASSLSGQSRWDLIRFVDISGFVQEELDHVNVSTTGALDESGIFILQCRSGAAEHTQNPHTNTKNELQAGRVAS